MNEVTFTAPSLKKLAKCFGEEKAKQLRAAMKATSPLALIERFPAAEKRWNECYHPPSMEDIIMHVCDDILGTCGVECIESNDGSVDYGYCNTGYSYAMTIMFDCRNQRFIVGDWGTIVEGNTRRYA